MVRCPEWHVPPLSREDLSRALKKARRSAPGADGRSPMELNLAPPGALSWLVSLLRLAEQGRGWPTAL
eukprot:806712-Alexandrium_andersonii.AAC.1